MNLYDNEYIKFAHDGNQYACLIHYDDAPEDPRKWENIGHMICFHRRYRLGDEHKYETVEAFLADLVCEYVHIQKIEDYIRDGKTGMAIYEPDSERDEFRIMAQLYSGELYTVCSANTEAGLFSDENEYDIVDGLSIREMLSMLNDCGEIVIMPLYLYEHSGITMRTTAFNDPWDSGQVGWIYVSRTTFLHETGYSEKSWPEQAIKMLDDEVRVYAEHLEGDCYGYELFMLDDETGEWESTGESCYGFFGSDIEDNGISDTVYGLYEAIKHGNFELGQATKHVITTVKYEFE